MTLFFFQYSYLYCNFFFRRYLYNSSPAAAQTETATFAVEAHRNSKYWLASTRLVRQLHHRHRRGQRRQRLAGVAYWQAKEGQGGNAVLNPPSTSSSTHCCRQTSTSSSMPPPLLPLLLPPNLLLRKYYVCYYNACSKSFQAGGRDDNFDTGPNFCWTNSTLRGRHFRNNYEYAIY